MEYKFAPHPLPIFIFMSLICHLSAQQCPQGDAPLPAHLSHHPPASRPTFHSQGKLCTFPVAGVQVLCFATRVTLFSLTVGCPSTVHTEVVYFSVQVVSFDTRVTLYFDPHTWLYFVRQHLSRLFPWTTHPVTCFHVTDKTAWWQPPAAMLRLMCCWRLREAPPY